MRKYIISLQVALFIVLVEWLGSCANIIPPTGGPKDSIPPVLVHANPPDSTTQFKSGKIVLTFNEFVELDKPTESIIVSPLPKNFTYIFTTGNHFDSLEFAGRVLVAETGKPDSTLIVMLHTKFDDSAVV